MNTTKRNLYFILIALCVADVIYSFFQHYNVALDGDLSVIVLPSEWYKQVLEDPFGLSVLLKKEVYAAPNRFFVHWSMMNYFKTVPLFLQSFLSPIDSVYASCGLAKTGIQIALLTLFSVYIIRLTKTSGGYSFFLAFILITPLFQTSGYNGLMGIIDKSITYSFFYAWSLAWLLLFYLPFATKNLAEKTTGFHWFTHLYLCLLTLSLPFSGPLIPGVVLIVCPAALLYFWWIHFNENNYEENIFLRFMNAVRNVPGPVLFYFMLISLLSLYSLFVGTSNAENMGKVIPIGERFLRIPYGIYYLLTQKLGLPLLLIMIATNAVLIGKFHKEDQEGKKILTVLKWIGLFTLIYILLLPFGGYRSYRPNILRRDTIMPVILALIFIYGWSSYYLIHRIRPEWKKRYVGALIVFLLVFTVADNPNFDGNQCERSALKQLADTPEKTVLLEQDCYVMSWEKMTDYKNSETNTKLLRYWGVLEGEKYYYQK